MIAALAIYMDCEVSNVEESENEALAELRIMSMRESLEALGRFDPARARARFLDSFDSDSTRKIMISGRLAGFYVVKDKGDHLYLDHLYIGNEFQRQGIGSAILSSVISVARNRGLPVRLGALRGSRSNQFYRAHGFVQTHEGEWDIYYELCHC